MKKILTFTLCLIYSSYCQAQKEKIELRLVNGETYRQKMISDATIAQSMGRQDINIKMGITGKIAYKVQSVLDTTYEIEVKYEQLGMKMNMPTGEISIDSEKELADDAFSKVLTAMKNNPFNLTMSKTGKIIAIRNIENLFKSLNELSQLSPVQKEQLKKQLSESYGEKAFTGNLGMSLAIFPSKSVSKGESWTVKGKLESGMKANLETIYELKEVGSDYYLISGTSKITTIDSEAYSETNGMQVKSNLNGTMNAEIKINKKTGWIIYSKTQQEINGTTSIKESEQLPGGMTLPLKMTSVITITDQ